MKGVEAFCSYVQNSYFRLIFALHTANPCIAFGAKPRVLRRYTNLSNKDIIDACHVFWAGLSGTLLYHQLQSARLQTGFHAFPSRIEWLTQSPIHRRTI